MKVTEIIRAALTRLGVYATGEEVPADDALPALEVLNELITEYKTQSLMGVPDSLELPLNIHDDVVLPNNLMRVLKLSLAVDLAPDYGVEPSRILLIAKANAITSLKHHNAEPIATKSAWSHKINGCY